ncbi:MAG: helix-hairpin-helix domain-containing protein [Candidatus Eisenbacteria bacterium]|uniref:Helix-hairpin-helix domain-containing protein n=1 Tax=Eiseniibacteriota bacterium TaxID=2212470 RepID=A0A7Y2EAY9_UNCEI|nr:helix-hairpin-helix domain-containing protein [Candidatus Eisenbacteria bacterium]
MLRQLLILCLGAVALATLVVPPALQAQSTPYSRTNQLDVNRATLEEIKQLPISPELAQAIVDHRTYRTYFDGLYELLEVAGMTPEILGQIRDLIFVTPRFEALGEDLTDSQQRLRERYYVVQRFLSEEGASEGLVDEYIDRIADPFNVNGLDYFDLTSFQNVSPIDAVAVLKEKEQAGRIESYRQLRSSPGLSYWGLRNLRNFVRYEEPETEKNELHGDYQVRMYNTPYLLDEYDNLTEVLSDGNTNFDQNTLYGRLGIDVAQPYFTNKLRLKLGTKFKGYMLTHRNLGETEFDETLKFSVAGERLVSGDTPLGKFNLRRAVLGNYRVAFGQGVIMESTDFFAPRRTGYGFGTRAIGLRPDFSRSDEFTLKGGAVEGDLGNVRGTLFYSKDDKDAILNPDGTFNRYIVMTPRLSNEFMEELREDLDGSSGFNPDYYQSMRDVMEETVTGANLKYQFVPGTYVGLTGVGMSYENNAVDSPGSNRWDPNPATLIIEPARRQEDRDAEIQNGYNSLNLGNYRRVWGAEAQTVFNNVSLAAEYGKLETNDDPDKSSVGRILAEGPEAFVANAYVQYENFNFLALYRDYDVGYDNPYQRSFSEDTKFEQTIIDGNPFRLNNPYWANMAMGLPQPKAEQGWYFFTRYQVSRQLTLTGLEFDTWKRKADGADLKRVTLRAEYRPVFPIRFRIRHRISSRHEERPDDIRKFSSWDSRIELRANLSKFDQVRFLYSTSNVTFATRPRLNAPADGGNTSDNQFPVRGIPAKAIQGSFTHNFNDFLTMTFSTQLYDGFLYNFEDNEFVVVDGNGFRNWILIRSRVSENLGWRLKWTSDHQKSRTFIDVRNFGDVENPSPDATDARFDQTSYRFQLDYSF